MASANGFGLTSAASNLVFVYDIGDTTNCYLGEPTTNQFAVLGTPGLGAASDNAVNFSIQGTTGFIRMGYGQTFGGYTIQPGDVVYKYNLGSYGCHYHGNTASIPSGVQATFSFEYYLSPDVSIETNFLANFENYGGNGLSGGIGVPNSTTGVWHKASFTSGPTAGTGTQAMFLYPGGCGGRLSAQGYILYKNPQVEWKAYPTQFVQGTRSSTQSLFNLRNQSAVNTNTVSFTTTPYTPQITFDGTDDTLVVSGINLNQNFTLEAIIKMYSRTSFGIFGQGTTAQNQGLHILYNYGNRGMIYGMYANDNDYGGNWVGELNTYYHVIFNYDNSTYNKEFYVNGILQTPASSTETVYSGTGDMRIGMAYGPGVGVSAPAYGEIPVAKIYNKVLTAAEVQNNYQNYKSRFNLS